MKKITLFCMAGMSTSMLVQRMQQEAAKQGKDYEINAYALTKVEQYGPGSDVILVGPQVRFAVQQVKDKCPGVPVSPIDMRMYGTMDAKSVLDVAEKLM